MSLASAISSVVGSTVQSTGSALSTVVNTAVKGAGDTVVSSVAKAIEQKGTEAATAILSGENPFKSKSKQEPAQAPQVPSVTDSEATDYVDAEVVDSGWITSSCKVSSNDVFNVTDCVSVRCVPHYNTRQVSDLLIAAGLRRKQMLAIMYLLENFIPGEVAYVA